MSDHKHLFVLRWRYERPEWQCVDCKEVLSLKEITARVNAAERWRPFIDAYGHWLDNTTNDTEMAVFDAYQKASKHERACA